MKHPLFVYLKDSISGGILGNSIKWNFTKFLCDKDGYPLKRLGPTQSALNLENDIERVLQVDYFKVYLCFLFLLVII